MATGPGPPLLGALIGTGSVTGSNILEITLNAQAPRSDFNTTRGVMIFVSSSEPSATAPSSFDGTAQNKRTPTISDSLGVSLTPPYGSTLQNQTASLFYTWLTYMDHAGQNYMIRGAWDYVIYHTIPAGGTITLDYSHAPPMDWLAANVHLVSNITRGGRFFQDILGLAVVTEGQGVTIDLVGGTVLNITGSGSFSQPFTYKYLAGMCLFAIVSLRDDQDFSVVGGDVINIPNKQYSLTRAGHCRMAYSVYHYSNYNDNSSSFFWQRYHSQATVTIKTALAGGTSGYYNWLLAEGTPGIFWGEPDPQLGSITSMKAKLH